MVTRSNSENELNEATDRSELDLSVVVISLNEEKNLPRMLASLPHGIELIVVDSGSTDKTIELATAAGAKIYHRDFDNYAAQKNFALSKASRNWILSLDSDEAISSELLQRIVAHVRTVRTGTYRLQRRLIFMNRLMRFGKTSDQPIRLFRAGSGQFISDIHETFVPNEGSTNLLAGGHIYHHSYENITDYFLRFNRYTSKIAENHFKNGKKPPLICLHVLRPFWEFISRYILRLGFCDGHPGFCYALFSSLYTFVKYEKLREIRRLRLSR